MTKLLKIEWEKIKPYTFFWIFSALYFFILCGAFYIAFHLMEFNGIKATNVSWHTITYLAGYFNFFLVLLVILYSTNEYQFNTYRQNVIDGLSRKQLYVSKLLIHLIITLYSTLSILILFVLMNLLSSQPFSMDIFNTELYYLFYHFIKCFCLLSLAYFITLVFKKGIISMLLFVVVWMIDVVLSMATNFSTLELLPFSGCGNLILNPMLAIPLGYSDLPAESIVMYSVIAYCVIFNLLSYWWLTKKDLKA